MSPRRRILATLAAVAVAAVSLALAGCSGLPLDGSVQAGKNLGEVPDAPDFAFLPDRPQPGATPEQIVEGFIRAASGPANGQWDRARLYLAGSLAQTWNPTASVTIDRPGDDRIVTVIDDDHIQVTVSPVATVDSEGVYEPTDGATPPLPFTLAKQPDGEWRIVEAPDGIVLDQRLFASVFRQYSLMYFDPTWQYLVPDQRWFPVSNAATSIATHLVNGGPSAWLDESVRTAFPEGVSVRASVPVTAGGVADVVLEADSFAMEQVALARMQRQLEASLETANVSSVEMMYQTTVIPVEAAAVRAARVSGPPLVLNDKGFGVLSGDGVDTVGGLSAAVTDVSPAPVAIDVDADRQSAAVLAGDGRVVRATTGSDPSVVDTRANLIAPSIDTLDYVWSVPHDDPAAVVAIAPDGTAGPVADAWPGATQITAMRVSRDGARVAAVVASGGRTVIWVAGIVRTDAGVPERLGEPVLLGTLPSAGAALAWLDDTTLGAVGRAGDASVVVEQTVGGPATTIDGPDGTDAIAAAAPGASYRLRTSDGGLYQRRGANWVQNTGGVMVLATQ